ncbi:MAG: cobalt-precorrin-6A reductase [Candidatus Velthaea sp.]
MLVLGGTRDAITIAQRLNDGSNCDSILSLAGRTSHPDTGIGEVRIGGFGGAAGLARFLTEHGIVAVVDATHPFAARMSFHAAVACARANVPLVALVREPWVASAGDRWVPASNVNACAALAAALGRRIFLTVGRQELEPFAALDEHWFLIRSIEPPDPPLPRAYELILARGPFAFSEELALMRAHAIDCVVTKNSGGAATQAKLLAARSLGIPVVMVARPARPADVSSVQHIEAAVDWVRERLAPVRA